MVGESLMDQATQLTIVYITFAFDASAQRLGKERQHV